jgi:hypothetical protein
MTRRVTELIYEVFIILKDVTMTWQKWGSKQALEKRETSLFFNPKCQNIDELRTAIL